MIHPQPRRDLVDDSPAGAAGTETVTATVPTQAAGPAGASPRRRDAYDLYAQIYALRGDGQPT